MKREIVTYLEQQVGQWVELELRTDPPLRGQVRETTHDPVHGDCVVLYTGRNDLYADDGEELVPLEFVLGCTLLDAGLLIDVTAVQSKTVFLTNEEREALPEDLSPVTRLGDWDTTDVRWSWE